MKSKLRENKSPFIDTMRKARKLQIISNILGK